MRNARKRASAIGGIVALAGSIAIAAPSAAEASPQCAGVAVSRLQAAKTPLLDWSENVAFDADGNLWVSRAQRGVVQKYARDGRQTASVNVSAPGAIRLGPDGLLYVTSGNTPTNIIPGLPRTGTVVRLDPRAPQPDPRVFATGFGMPNGMTFGPDNYLYVTDSRLGLLRVSPRGRIDAAWSARAPKSQAPSPTVNGFSLNGIASSGDDLFVTMTSSVTGRILRVPIADPSRTSVAADLTAPVPGLFDDLIAPHPDVLVVTTVTGQVLTANLRTHSTCAVSVGQPVTALAADPRRPGRLVAGTESGDVLSLQFPRH